MATKVSPAQILVSVNDTSVTANTTSYTVKASDAGSIVVMNNTNAVTIYIPDFNAVPFPKGTEIILVQRGGVATVQPANGNVTLVGSGNKYKTNGTNSGICVINIGQNLWFVGGDRSA